MKIKHLKGVSVALLAAFTLFQRTTELPKEALSDGPVMVRSSFNIFPTVQEEQKVDVLQKKAKEPSEQIGAATNTGAPVNGSTAQSSTAQASTASQSASSGKNSIGPSIKGQITTEGEKGVVHESMLGGAKLIMLKSESGKQILSCIIQTSQGKMIVIDGGFGTDAPVLLDQLWARGGHVGAWLVTHPHADHVGALFEVLEYKERNLTIDGVYYSLAEPSWYSQRDAKDQEMAHALINTLSQMPAEMLRGDIGKGTQIMVDDVKIEVMNSRYDVYQDSGNNASMVYKITVNGKSILFLGDMGEEGGKKLLADCGDSLKSDIVQVAHHGQNGVGHDVYRAINPSICLWPTPQWLWDNDNGSGPNTGSWPIAATKGWLNQVNPNILHYAIKDGDQTIE